MAGRKVRPCDGCGFEPSRRPHRGRYDHLDDAAVPNEVEIVHLLAKRPDLREVFPVADAVDQAVRG